MKRALVLVAVLLGGCSVFRSPMEPAVAPAVQPSPDVAAIQRVPFRVGTSSTTVEKLAREQACTSAQGAGLMTEPGPVEVYRVRCDNGKVFTARCELRQCRSM
ncbi:hypothetical protein [Massilia sp. YIM B02443]|uniref:hypothetical protein n=1 Tax=Massilia sp. YIM B02443 TaxID=3050127 RepID=UPI0025B6CE5C|nr:hypothetical protein [Massilia sp. YIM B02443]MDN4035824.1 hypothetical protein [Massilia sp. YIM B02443]